MKKTTYIIIIILFVIYLFIFSSSSSGYYEYSNNKKTVFTEEKIKEFEKDIEEGKKVDINNYLEYESKDYNNKITNIGLYISDIINKTVNFILKSGFKIIENMIS